MRVVDLGAMFEADDAGMMGFIWGEDVRWFVKCR